MENHFVLNSRKRRQLQQLCERFIRVVKGFPPSDLHALLLFYGEEILDSLWRRAVVNRHELNQLSERIYQLGRNPQLEATLVDEVRDLRESLQAALQVVSS